MVVLTMFLNAKLLSIVFVPLAFWTLSAQAEVSELHSGFVDVSVAVPGVLVEPRYAGPNNFIGKKIDGYDAETVIVSKEVAAALYRVQATLQALGMALKLYDGYRPQRAVDHFARWAKDHKDTLMKADYYPNIAKGELFKLGYIAERSGHSRGGSVDLTVVERADDGTWAELEMGSPWDLFDERSHASSTAVSQSAQKNRQFLADIMVQNGFTPYAEEWWHFTLVPEPYPDTYFDFPIR